jgi:hypothetical protein
MGVQWFLGERWREERRVKKEEKKMGRDVEKMARKGEGRARGEGSQ